MQPEEHTSSTQALAADAIDQARSLMIAEIDLAKDDLRRVASRAARSAALFGVAGVAALAGIETLVLGAAGAGRRDRG